MIRFHPFFVKSTISFHIVLTRKLTSLSLRMENMLRLCPRKLFIFVQHQCCRNYHRITILCCNFSLFVTLPLLGWKGPMYFLALQVYMKEKNLRRKKTHTHTINCMISTKNSWCEWRSGPFQGRIEVLQLLFLLLLLFALSLSLSMFPCTHSVWPFLTLDTCHETDKDMKGIRKIVLGYNLALPSVISVLKSIC